MSGIFGHAERDAIKSIAHLLPANVRRALDLLAEDVPPTATAMKAAPDDAAAARLARIEHIVVLMQENRSFDHMLGYLSLPLAEGGRARADVDGLRGIDVNSNTYDGMTYPIHHETRTKFATEAEDPDHSGTSVDEQLANDNGGFVANFARYSTTKAEQLRVPVPDPGLVMGYYTVDELPVYDHLAAEYCVVDRWFSSVPGATWPNRLYAAAGQAQGSRDDISPPIYALPAFPRYLEERGVDFRWYSFDPGTLRAIDPQYRLSHHDFFAYLDQRALTIKERAIGEFTEQGPSFLDDARGGNLPAVSWIDPHFKDFQILGPDSNDDHSPSDITAGQELVLTIYHALTQSPNWPTTLFIVVYDEHGGFYDHVSPPSCADVNPEFHRLGVRVPALLVSPLVAAGSTSTAMLGSDFHFDHTSIIKTILTRFCAIDGQIPAMTERVAAANHLGHLLSDAPSRPTVADPGTIADKLTNWRAGLNAARFVDATAAAPPLPQRLTALQTGFTDVTRLLREAGLPNDHP
jgi:phospholipase C